MLTARGFGGAPKDHKCIAIDVVPNGYADVAAILRTMHRRGFQRRAVEPPPLDLRQRVHCNTQCRHAEVSHDVWMTRVVLEMVLDIQSEQGAPKRRRRHKSEHHEDEIMGSVSKWSSRGPLLSGVRRLGKSTCSLQLYMGQERSHA